MTSLFFIVSASLLLVLAMPDSSSHDDQRQAMSGIEPTSLEMPRRSEVMRHDPLANNRRLGEPNVYTCAAFANPIAGHALGAFEAIQETPVIRAARNHVHPISREENKKTPQEMPITGQRAAIVSPSGHQLIEMLRQRRNAALDILKPYQLFSLVA